MECLKPIFIDTHPFQPMPCRTCKNCLRNRRNEWTNRMILESYANECVPLFTTFTYAPENYKETLDHAKKHFTNFLKRLRKKGHDIRYFTVIEQGTKRKRYHNHAIIWSKSLNRLDAHSRFITLFKEWKNGRIDVQEIKHRGGLFYLTKYMFKDIKKGTRTYSWSNKPTIGARGIQRWETLTLKRHADTPYTQSKPPSGKIQIKFKRQLVTAYIPKDNYLRFLKKYLNLELAPEKIKYYGTQKKNKQD